jgi:hypothetical protein
MSATLDRTAGARRTTTPNMAHHRRLLPDESVGDWQRDRETASESELDQWAPALAHRKQKAQGDDPARQPHTVMTVAFALLCAKRSFAEAPPGFDVSYSDDCLPN